ncbi:MAG: transglutaminase domain-containing protein [Candidatus Electryonea clarkiae]|nr:transglutaminase domain-containing protein [Candidatus Electryonea clarkiae]MDP8286158.1 transglutaminase domain-containing protein [Candidatus Electryonea clarkiae]
MNTYCRFFLFLILLFAFVPFIAQAAPGDIVSSIPAPCTMPTGLAFDGNLLWVADRLTDTLYAVDPVSGSVSKKLPAPGFVPTGLAWDGQHLWCVDREDARIYQLDVNTGITLKSIESPTASPQGITWDGEFLWLADGGESVICKISPDDGTAILRYPEPDQAATGLTWWNGQVWCADRKSDRIYLFDPQYEEVVFGLDSPGKYPRGLTTDGNTLWNVDYQDDKIYQLVIEDDENVKLKDQKTLNMLLSYEFRNYGPGEVPSLDVYIAVPNDLPNQKLLGKVNFNPDPTDIIKDQWKQRIAHFALKDLQLAQRQVITMETEAELATAQTFVFPNKVGSLDDIPGKIKELYLTDEDKYSINDPIIQDAIKNAIGEETNPYWMMRKIHKYIRDRLHYELSGGWNTAPRVLERGNGSCSEYTFVFISMCRAAGIPARYVGAVVVRGDDASTDEYFHRWSQVYLPGYGWIHVDPQGGDKTRPSDIAGSIGNISNRFLITTVGGGASRYLDWNYNYNEKWTGKGPVKIHSEAIGEWSPVEEKRNDKE